MWTPCGPGKVRGAHIRALKAHTVINTGVSLFEVCPLRGVPL